MSCPREIAGNQTFQFLVGFKRLLLCLILALGFSETVVNAQELYGVSGQTVIKIGDGHITALRLDGEKLAEVNTTPWIQAMPPEHIFSSPAGTICKLNDKNAYVIVGFSEEEGITIKPLHIPQGFESKQITGADGEIYAYGETRGIQGIYVYSLAEKHWKELITLPKSFKETPSLVVQNDGRSKNLYAFGMHECFYYDLTDKVWKEIHLTEGIPDLSTIAATSPIGAHAILLVTGKGLYSYHTITQSFAAYDSSSDFPFEANLLLVDQEAAYMTDGKELYPLKLVGSKHEFGVVNYLVLILYLLVLIGIGIFYSRRQVTTEDYFKGGGRIPWWAAGLSLFGTGLSAITFMAIPAKTFATDWAYFFFQMTPLLAIPIVVKVFIPFFKRLNVTSAYQYLELRFNLATRLFGSLSFLLFQLGRVGVVLYLPAIALNMVTDISISTCIIGMGVVSVIYTIMGGIEAVIWTDVLQVVILLGGALLALFVMILDTPKGISGIYDIATAGHKFELVNFAFDFTHPTFWVVILGGFFANLISSGSDQSMVQRYLTTSDEKSAKQSAWVFAIMAVPATLLFFSIGTALYAFYKTHPGQLDPAMQISDAVFPWYIINELPVGISGLVIAGLFSAAMSSLSSSMNSAATVFIEDFYQRLMVKTKTNNLRAAKVATLVFGVAGCTFALLMASWDIKSLWDQFQLFIGLFAGGLGGLFLLGMTTIRANGAGAVIGLLLSGCIQYYLSTYTDMHILLFTGTGVVSCYILSYLFSMPLAGHNKPLAGLTIYTISNKRIN